VDGTVVSVSEESASKDQVEFELGPAIAETTLPQITVILSIYKFDRLEWAIEKLTELGVASVAPVISRRTEPHLAKAAEKRVERWRRIAHEAAQQSRRPSPPEIDLPVPLSKALARTEGCRIVLSELEENVSLKSALEGSHSAHCSRSRTRGGWAPKNSKPSVAPDGLRRRWAATILTETMRHRGLRMR